MLFLYTFRKQIKDSRKLSLYQHEKNELNDKLGLLQQRLLFLTSEKYEAEKWVIKVDKAFVEAYKELRSEKRGLDPEPEYIDILEDQVNSARKSRDNARVNISDVQMNIDNITKDIERTEFATARLADHSNNLFLQNDSDDNSYSNMNVTKKKPRMARRSIISVDDMDREVDAIFCENDTNVTPSTYDIDKSMDESDIDVTQYDV